MGSKKTPGSTTKQSQKASGEAKDGAGSEVVTEDVVTQPEATNPPVVPKKMFQLSVDAYYTDEKADEICARMRRGQGLLQICEEMGIGGMETIFAWRKRYVYFSESYAQAREDQADAMDMLMVDLTKRVEAKLLDPHSARVIIDVYKWRAERLKPKVYGAQSQITHITEAKEGEIGRLSKDELIALKAQLAKPVIEGTAVDVTPNTP